MKSPTVPHICMQFVAAKHAYLTSVESQLGSYLVELDLHRQSQQEVAQLTSEVARWVRWQGGEMARWVKWKGG